MKRSFLFLQGVSSPFFTVLAKRLREDGHRVAKVNFTGGDAFYWRGGGSTSFRLGAVSLPGFYEKLFDTVDHCTDVVMFGDCRPVHAAVITGARSRGKAIHVFEEGYFRPYWITLERGGVNGASKLPKDPAWYSAVGPHLPQYRNGQAFSTSFFGRAWHDVQYHTWSSLNPILYPGYRTHAPYTAMTEYLGFIRRAATFAWRVRNDERRISDLLMSDSEFYFLPLQLDSDAQIRLHSTYTGMEEVLTTVMESFALHAPSSTKLVIKNHPLDPGLVNYKKIVDRLEALKDIRGRVVYLESGHLPSLLDRTRGVVTVNSTVGASALVHKRPTIALADPIYNLVGLTFRGSLDDFWLHATPPNMRLFRNFRNTVIHTTQVNGGFYSTSGIELAVANSLRSLCSEKSPLEALL